MFQVSTENRKELGFQAPISGVVAQVITPRYRLRQRLDVKYHYFASISVKYSSERKTTLVGSGPISPSNGKKVILNIRWLTQKSMSSRTTKFQIILHHQQLFSNLLPHTDTNDRRHLQKMINSYCEKTKINSCGNDVKTDGFEF